MSKRKFILLSLAVLALLAGCAKRNTEYKPDDAVTRVRQISVVGNPLDISFDANNIYAALDQGGIAVINSETYAQKWFPEVVASDGSHRFLGQIKKISMLPEFNRLFINEVLGTDKITVLDTSDPDTLVYKFDFTGGTGGIKHLESYPLNPPSGIYTMAVGYGTGEGFRFDRYDGNLDNGNVYTVYSPAPASGFYLTADKIYLACEQRGLQIYDHASRQLLGQIALPGEARKVEVSGNYAFVAARQAGFHVVDISDPATPVLVSTFNTTGYASTVDVQDDKAVVSSTSGGVYIFDITYPASFFLLQRLDDIGYANNAKFYGDQIVIATRDQGILIYEFE